VTEGKAKLRQLLVYILTVLFLLIARPDLVHAVCDCGNGDGAPLLAPIAIDGNFGDWAPVLADQDNIVCDGPNIDSVGNTLADLDAPVQSTGRDMTEFAFTWDGTNLYLYTARTGSPSNTQNFIYYADIDNDGLMETGEPIIEANWKGNNRTVTLSLGTYQAFAASGDPMTDPSGFGDGYTLPGTVPSTTQYAQGTWGSASGIMMEIYVPWGALVVAPGTGHSIHVSSTNSNVTSPSLPSQVDDNIGGCGGGGGTLQFADLDFSGASSLQGGPLSTVYGPHHLINLGNGDDTFAFASSVSGTHLPTITYFLDADSDGAYTPTVDTPILAPVFLAPGDSLDMLVACTIGAGAAGLATVVTTATSGFDPTVFDSVTDTVDALSPDIIVLKSAAVISDPVNGSSNPKAIPLAEVLYTVQVSNQGNGSADTDSVNIADSIPADSSLFVGDLSGTAGSGPVIFTDGATTSGLTYTFIDLDDLTDDLAFSSDSGSSYAYTPSPDVDGYDSAVTNIRVNPKGAFFADTGSGTPGFQIRYKVRVK